MKFRLIVAASFRFWKDSPKPKAILSITTSAAIYQYDIQLKSISPTETAVHVNAKITAWYAGTTSANSGYRLLKSSGRLESDLLDALDDKLNPNSAARTTAPSPKTATGAALPDSPSANDVVFHHCVA